MNTPICPMCGETLIFKENADLEYYFNEESGKYDICEKDSLTGLICDNCGESPWVAWEQDDSTNMFELMNDITPADKFIVQSLATSMKGDNK